MAAAALMVWGTASGVGKSWLAAALCRWAARQGIAVAPYKAQNMSNNARVVARGDGGWGEIGAAQYFQALAAGVTPTTDMNPVLLKPEAETASQVVVDGRVEPALAVQAWHARAPRLAAAARAAYERLAARHELVILEGAGSPAEINLAASDYVNLDAVRWSGARAILVADIDRGGAFAHLAGTHALLPADLRGALDGFVLNKFRGDVALLAPAPAALAAHTGVPVIGVVPMRRGHGLPEEDGVFDEGARGSGAAVRCRVAVVATPQVSNLDEFEPLAAVPGVRLAWARTPSALEGADWIVLPGSKHTAGDLAWLRANGLAESVRAHAAAGGAVLGICGGLQMLGATLADPAGVDGPPAAAQPGLGLLPLATTFAAPKRVRPGRVRFGAAAGAWAPLAGAQAGAYEIRCGRSRVLDAALAPVLHADDGTPIGWQAGNVLGVYAHGLFESAGVLQALFGAAAPTLASVFDGLADVVEAHCDSRWLARLRARVPSP